MPHDSKSESHVLQKCTIPCKIFKELQGIVSILLWWILLWSTVIEYNTPLPSLFLCRQKWVCCRKLPVLYDRMYFESKLCLLSRQTLSFVMRSLYRCGSAQSFSASRHLLGITEKVWGHMGVQTEIRTKSVRQKYGKSTANVRKKYGKSTE